MLGVELGWTTDGSERGGAASKSGERGGDGGRTGYESGPLRGSVGRVEEQRSREANTVAGGAGAVGPKTSQQRTEALGALSPDDARDGGQPPRSMEALKTLS